MANDEAAKQHLLPEGRVINQSVFKLDQYDEKAAPRYTIEIAYEEGVLDDFWNACLDAADAKWGEGAGEDDTLIIPFMDGNVMKEKREAKGKSGDAYGGMTVLRASTQFNRDGIQGADGGIQVFAPDTSEIGIANQGEFYQGCMAKMAVTINTYVSEGKHGNPDQNAISFYLSAVQKTGEGEKLVTSSDRSGLFKPVAGAKKDDEEKPAKGGRKKRAG